MAWELYASELERITAEFPGTVERRFFGAFPDDGISPATVVYTCKLSQLVTYQVGVTRVLTYFGLAEDFIRTAFENFAGGITEGALIESSRAMFKGLPALRFLMQVGQILDLRGIATLKGRTLYFLTLMHLRGTEQEFERFCAAFQIDP